MEFLSFDFEGYSTKYKEMPDKFYLPFFPQNLYWIAKKSIASVSLCNFSTTLGAKGTPFRIKDKKKMIHETKQSSERVRTTKDLIFWGKNHAMSATEDYSINEWLSIISKLC